MALDDQPSLLGLYLYQAGVSFVAASAQQIADERARSCVEQGQQWWELAGLLAYWHEADHYQTFSCSPYLQHALNLSDSYSWWCAAAISESRPASGWRDAELPLLVARTKGAVSEHASVAVDFASAARVVIYQMLHGQITDSMANRLTLVTRASAAHRGIESCSFRADAGVQPTSPHFPRGLTASDLYEAMGRLTELGHLVAWGATTEQIDFWRQSMIFGQYKKVLGPMLGLMDTDLVHAALVLAFRSGMFPYLASDSEDPHRVVDLNAEHPVARFINMTNFMFANGLARASTQQRRTSDSASRFHDAVIDELIDRFPVVRDDSGFRATEDTIWAPVKAGRAASPVGWDGRLQEMDHRTAARARRFALELRDPHKWLASEPTMIPRALLTDAEFDGKDYFPRRVNVNSIGGYEGQAIHQAVGDIIVFGDLRLYGSVSEIFRHAPDRTELLRLALDGFGIDRPLDSIPYVAWDNDLDFETAQAVFDAHDLD